MSTQLRLYWVSVETASGDVQVLRPVSDITSIGWTDQMGGTTNLFDAVNEAIADDADYAALVDPTSAQPLILGIIGTDPGVDTNHILRYRIGRQGPLPTNWTIRLLQGTIEIASWVHNGVTTPTTFSQTLSQGQAAAITDYTTLRISVEAST